MVTLKNKSLKYILLLLFLLSVTGCNFTHENQWLFAGSGNNWEAKYIYDFKEYGPGKNDLKDELLVFYKGDEEENPQNVKIFLTTRLGNSSDEQPEIRKGQWVSTIKDGGGNVALLNKDDVLEVVIKWDKGEEQISLSFKNP